jgi:hypothetical protein
MLIRAAVESRATGRLVPSPAEAGGRNGEWDNTITQGLPAEEMVRSTELARQSHERWPAGVDESLVWPSPE